MVTRTDRKPSAAKLAKALREAVPVDCLAALEAVIAKLERETAS